MEIDDDINNIDLNKIDLSREVIDLDYMEKLMNKFCRNHHKNYLDFVIFVRRMVPYITSQNRNVIIGEDVRRIL